MKTALGFTITQFAELKSEVGQCIEDQAQYGHYTAPAAGKKMQETKKTTVRHLSRSDEGIWHCGLENTVVRLFFCRYSFLFMRSWLYVFNSMGIQQGSWRWGVVLNKVVSRYTFSLPFILLPSCNKLLMGARMEITLKTGSINFFFKYEKTEVLIRELLCADDAAIAAHSEIVVRLAEAWHLFGLTISVRKT